MLDLITLTQVGFAYLLFLQAGFLFLRLARVYGPDFSKLETVCLAFGLGVGLVTTQMLLLSLVGIRLTLLIISGMWGLAWSLYLTVQTMAHRTWRKESRRQFLSQLTSTRITFNFPAFLGGFLVFTTIAAVFFAAILYPLRDWDSWAIWELKARAFYYHQTSYPTLG